MSNRLARWAAGWMIATATLMLPGCPEGEPPETSVLQGDWELSGALVAEDISEFLLTFDEDGRITELSYRVGAARIRIDGEFINSSATVEGSNVSLVATWFAVNSLFFEGTLNAAETTVTGTVSYELQVGAITIEVPAGDATLTRQ